MNRLFELIMNAHPGKLVGAILLCNFLVWAAIIFGVILVIKQF